MKTRIAAIVVVAAVLLTGCTTATEDVHTETLSESETAYLSRVREHQPQRSTKDLIAGGRAACAQIASGRHIMQVHVYDDDTNPDHFYRDSVDSALAAVATLCP